MHDACEIASVDFEVSEHRNEVEKPTIGRPGVVRMANIHQRARKMTASRSGIDLGLVADCFRVEDVCISERQMLPVEINVEGSMTHHQTQDCSPQPACA